MRLIQNGTILYQGKLQPKDILFDENNILKIEDHIENCQEYEYTDASGLIVLPGLIDTHVHLRDPGYTEKETIATGSRAAAHGGFTTIFAMPNLNPYPSTPEVYGEYQKRLQSEGVIDVRGFATITDNEAGFAPSDYAGLKALGVHWFSDDGVGVASDAIMEAAMKKAKENDVLFSCHTEDMNYRKPGASVHDSRIAEENGWTGIPSACEYSQLIRDLHLAQKIGCKYHADHISAKESVDAIRLAKAKGADVSAEVTVHHLLLIDEDVKGPNWKMNPPLRSRMDREALIQGLEEGTLDFIANDHAPHTKEEKMRPMDKAPFGIVTIECAFPLLYTEFVHKQKRWSLEQLASWMSEKPARRFGLRDRGVLEEGMRPDFVLIDTSAESVIDPDTFCSKGKNTPFAGWSVHACVMETISGGKTVWKEARKG